jgi:hypothetical protein
VARELREELGRGVQLTGNIGTVTQYFKSINKPLHFKMQAQFFTAVFTDDVTGGGEFEMHQVPLDKVQGAFFYESHEWAIQYAVKFRS